ncbi:MAG: M48 family metalloprotease, partial [Pseudomonadota bacterium]
RDTLIMTIAATVAGAISVLANIGLWMGGNRDRGQFGAVGVILAAILAPMAAGLIQMTVSRTREYGADRVGAEISGKPLALASALQKIAGAARYQQMPSAEINPNSAHMFIINPLIGKRLDALFSTHPPAERRIAALQAMAAEGTYRAPQPRRAERRSRIPTVRRR